MTENVQAPPEPLVSGKFALYQTPKQGLHLTMQVDGEAEPRHIEIPAMMVKLLQKRMGSPNGLVPQELSMPDTTIDIYSSED